MEIDLSRFATKDDLNAGLNSLRSEIAGLDERLSSRIDKLDAKLDAKIDSSVKRLSAEIVNTQADVREIKEKMMTKDEFSRMMSVIDGIAGHFESRQKAVLLHGETISDIQVKLKDHDRRLGALEARPSPSGESS